MIVWYFTDVVLRATVHALIPAALLTIGLGLTVAVTIAVLVAVRVSYLHPDPVTPAAFRKRTESTVSQGSNGLDRGWPGYLVSQPDADLAARGTGTRACYRWAWAFARTALKFLWKWGWPALVVLPLLAAILVSTAGIPLEWCGIAAVPGITSVVAGAVFMVAMLVAEVVGFIILLAYVPAHMLQTLLGRPARGLMGGVLRAFDAATGGRGASCPSCYYVMDRPSYRCGGCGTTHADVRPGRLGLLWRRCECGERLSLTVVRATRQLDAVCVRCGEVLPELSGIATQVRIAVFGDPRAGKSRLVATGVQALLDAAASSGSRASLSDTGPTLEVERDRIRDGSDLEPTVDGARPATVVLLRRGSSAANVQLFDVAGRRFRGGKLHDEHGFLSTAHGLVFVVDPFALEPIAQLAGQSLPNLVREHAPTGNIETAYSEVVQRVRSTTQARSQRLAVVLTKVDLLQRARIEVPTSSADLSTWLQDLGLHNLVASARLEFAGVRYFAVSSTIPADTTYDAGAPFRWLLGVRGPRLLGARQAAQPARATPEPVGS